ncbi:aldehyde dehydrogenase family protein [Hymenobacter latericus]|uniref:aldehyde dehydrogenase family protein n=1 Tax=Hymenobacter sp. YIM 151858-1 TaxID=2987688 RepID=UPI002227CB03|nr:aldehyde dehydrogenase family protein [Hymenobacter sp. YIM 151858-1]UYZ57949.1 aldehyde dehydrogenase family protein [Hymenobacter sp. YIM 151858-1]
MSVSVAPATAALAPDTAALQHLFRLQKGRSEALRREEAAERIRRLQRLHDWIAQHRDDIRAALYHDFRKPATETDVTEIYATQAEIRHAIKHLKQWMRPRRVGTPLALLGTTSWVQYEPKGVCLIMAPWNYPFYLAIGPLVSALAAGNCCIVKPSEMTPGVAALIARLAREVFDPAEVSVVEGDKDVATALLQLPFDHIFFTGSPQVGKIVMRAAAEHLASVTLELGGKSPAVIDDTADLRDAAEKLVWGKCINAGQTCVAPDYLLVHERVKDQLIEEIRQVLHRFYDAGGRGVAQSESYARIVNSHHFGRLARLLEDAQQRGATIAVGGSVDHAQCFIEPTVLLNAPPDSAVMQEEIFGPLLPVQTFGNLMEAVDFINARPHPLALYVFTRNAENQRYLLGHVPAGGACVNDTIVHLGHPELPFGGFGNSGIGRAHGHYGFVAFSNEKAVLQQRVGKTGIKMFYPPYTERVRKMVGWLLKFL